MRFIAFLCFSTIVVINFARIWVESKISMRASSVSSWVSSDSGLTNRRGTGLKFPKCFSQPTCAKQVGPNAAPATKTSLLPSFFLLFLSPAVGLRIQAWGNEDTLMPNEPGHVYTVTSSKYGSMIIDFMGALQDVTQAVVFSCCDPLESSSHDLHGIGSLVCISWRMQ